jgi:hypothetical protein
MTKVTILREEDKASEEPIEFTHFLDKYGLEISPHHPKNFGDIVLLCKNYSGRDIDLMLAYNDDGENVFLFLGHFNSGKVQE